MCAIDSAECWEWSVHYNRRAAKPHRCSECHRQILKGEMYRYTAGKYDGMIESYHTCRHCLVMCEWLIQNCGGYLSEGVIEDFDEHAREYPLLASSIHPIVLAALAKWNAGTDAVPSMPPSIAWASGVGEQTGI